MSNGNTLTKKFPLKEVIYLRMISLTKLILLIKFWTKCLQFCIFIKKIINKKAKKKKNILTNKTHFLNLQAFYYLYSLRIFRQSKLLILHSLCLRDATLGIGRMYTTKHTQSSFFIMLSFLMAEWLPRQLNLTGF